MNRPTALPSIARLDAGLAWLNALPLADLDRSQTQLTAGLHALQTAPPDPQTLFALLEKIRDTLCFVADTAARRLWNKALPQAADEAAAFARIDGLWRALAAAYEGCLPATTEPPPAVETPAAIHQATVLQRRLHCVGMRIVEHYRVRRELPPGLWRQLHDDYRRAEAAGLDRLPVADALGDPRQATHCAAAYLTPLLVETASPYSRSLRDLNLIQRWATRWATLALIHPAGEATGETDGAAPASQPPHRIDLDTDQPLHPGDSGAQASAIRRLDTRALGAQISHSIEQLRQGMTPASLGLGDDLPGHVARLLDSLSHPWTQAASPRRFRRFPAQAVARVATGFERIYRFITGAAFAPAAAARVYAESYRRDQAIIALGEQVEGGARDRRPTDIADEWAIINHSATGFRLARNAAGQKLLHGQLIAICPHDGEAVLLAHARWLMQESDGGLLAGVATLPGVAQGIGVRPAGDRQAAFQTAFLLPPTPAVGEAGSLVLPHGLFRPGQALDISQAGDLWRGQMLHVVQRGADFDRVTWRPA